MTAQRQYLVLTAIGPDRPGLVNEMAKRIHAVGANLEDSRMAILGGEFALLMLVSGDSAALARLQEGVPETESSLGLSLMVKQTGPTQAPKDYLPYKIRVSGVDRPGIVHTISTILAGERVNVASLQSRLMYAPLSGTPMFILEADLQVPSQLGVSLLRQKLGRACEEENLDWSLETAR